MPDRSNPDQATIWQDRYDRSRRDYFAGGSEAVLKASLYGLGYIGVRLNDEVAYLRSLRESNKTVEDPAGIGGFVSGLPDKH